MRWKMIRLIWLRDLRDQLRDRRTLLMIAGLPLFIYPALGFAVLHFARGFGEKESVIGVVSRVPGSKEFPARTPPAAGRSPTALLAWFSATPRLDGILGAAGLAGASAVTADYPGLVEGTVLPDATARVRVVFLDPGDKDALAERRADVVLSASDDFYGQLEEGEVTVDSARPVLRVDMRPDDDHSRLAWHRLQPVLLHWKAELVRARLARRGLPPRFDAPIYVHEPQAGTAPSAGVVDLVVRTFPFMLVMWSLAGALYPAVDLCAGEKERGTMETLLITPAGREEIVLGKFLTIWIFSAGTALLNLVSMGLTTWHFSSLLPQGSLPLGALLWCVVLSLPQAALFSAVSLAIGAYARSTKEGQYYLMPLFVLTMPLIFLTLAPGVELNAFYSLVPITGVALLMQRLMTASSFDQVPWLYFLPVLAPVAIYSLLALRWAIGQFQREEVLFREAERLDVKLWLKHLLRDKDPLPTAGQAFFCFAMILGLRWLSLTLGDGWPLEVHTSVILIAFVATPPLLMALMLCTRPRDAFFLRAPAAREVGLAAILALLFLPPITGLTQLVAHWSPGLLDDRHPLVGILRASGSGRTLDWPQLVSYLLAFALLPAVCEELAFRGFLLCGLQRFFRPRNAVLLSAFMFALYHMNVFLFLPTFFLGVALGLLTVRSRSLLPAVALHFLHNAVLIASIPLGEAWEDRLPLLRSLWSSVIAGCLVLAFATLWRLYRKPYVDLARSEAHAMPHIPHVQPVSSHPTFPT